MPNRDKDSRWPESYEPDVPQDDPELSAEERASSERKNQRVRNFTRQLENAQTYLDAVTGNARYAGTLQHPGYPVKLLARYAKYFEDFGTPRFMETQIGSLQRTKEGVILPSELESLMDRIEANERFKRHEAAAHQPGGHHPLPPGTEADHTVPSPKRDRGDE